MKRKTAIQSIKSSIVEHETGIPVAQGHVDIKDIEEKSEQVNMDKEQKNDEMNIELTDKKMGKETKKKDSPESDEKDREARKEAKERTCGSLPTYLIYQLEKKSINRRCIILPKVFM